MAAGEDQAHEVVLERLFRPIGGRRRRLDGVRDLRLFLGKTLLAPEPIKGFVARRRDQPGERVPRNPARRPLSERHRERFLKGVLGNVEVTEEPDQGGEGARPLLAIQRLEFHPPGV